MPRVFLPDHYNAKGAGNYGPNCAPGEDMEAEAENYEILKQHRRPNICVTGAVQNGDCAVDPHLVLDGILKGLHFLHDTLNLVRNDINPTDIMPDDDRNAVFIDFDPIGQEIGLFRKAGTFGWNMNPSPTVSLPESDRYGLTLIANFLE
ncbi:hypothetical protein BS47DRAFT_1362836 [Hydnum rufescens UP504]|uniref:Uncharacterized protein n=1 Tax=Hydnum rufescens UP504 TaxID=1448309 RepID=A0A9P6DVR0_9AGAM|nr:hypothetical protein BS47DRAFT_1362836 [Hydnum rufescens UP504]